MSRAALRVGGRMEDGSRSVEGGIRAVRFGG